MCDETDLANFDRLKPATGRVNRRQFGVMGAAATLAACASGPAEAGDASALAEGDVTVTTPDGTMDGFFVHPADGAHPAVIIWPDIAGLRDAFKNMARRLAASGYAVLVANPFYRDKPAPQFADFADFREKDGFQAVGPWRAKMTPEAIGRDAVAFAAWLDAQDAVDPARGIGTQGYCMGGPLTVWSAVGTGRVKACCSFHGGGLVTEDAQSPHKLLGQTDARFLIAVAQNDDARAPEEKTVFAEAAAAAGKEAEVEVYAGDHGWTVPDSPVYAQEAAEKAWARLLATYAAAL